MGFEGADVQFVRGGQAALATGGLLMPPQRTSIIIATEVRTEGRIFGLPMRYKCFNVTFILRTFTQFLRTASTDDASEVASPCH